MSFYESLKRSFEIYSDDMELKKEYQYRLGQIESYYYSLDQNELDILHENLLAIYAFDSTYKRDANFVIRAVIDFIYYLAEEQISLYKLETKKSIVMAFSLAKFAKKAVEEKRPLWFNDELICGLIEFEEVEDAVEDILIFQDRYVVIDSEQMVMDEFVVADDERIAGYVNSYIKNIMGLRRVRIDD